MNKHLNETTGKPFGEFDDERISSLDVLRGVAVLGILLINIVGMGAILQAEDYFGHDAGPALGWGMLDQITWWISQLFIEGTMRGLFTLLFGAGFILFCDREHTASGRSDIGALYLRRVSLLITFGVFHALVLFWPGDILLLYGFAGLLLYPFRRSSPKTLIVAGLCMLLALSAFRTFEEAAAYQSAMQEETKYETLPDSALIDLLDEEQWAEEIRVRQGGFFDNAVYFRQVFTDWLFDRETPLWTIDALAFMLLGAALLKIQIICATRSIRFYRNLAILGYLTGVSLNAVEAYAVVAANFSPAVIWPAATYQLSRFFTTLGHLGLILYLLKIGACQYLFSALSKVGRMALSNYLAQSAIAAILFSGFGFGWYGTLNRPELWTIAVCIWMVQILTSHYWLAYFRIGPAEWLWRSLTYGAIVKFRKFA